MGLDFSDLAGLECFSAAAAAGFPVLDAGLARGFPVVFKAGFAAGLAAGLMAGLASDPCSLDLEPGLGAGACLRRTAGLAGSAFGAGAGRLARTRAHRGTACSTRSPSRAKGNRGSGDPGLAHVSPEFRNHSSILLGFCRFGTGTDLAVMGLP